LPTLLSGFFSFLGEQGDSKKGGLNYVVVVFDPDNCFMSDRSKCLYIRQRIKRRYCKEKALKLFGDPDFLLRVLRVIDPCSPVCGIIGERGDFKRGF